MENLIFLIPAAISLFWVVRIFLLKDVNSVQLLFVAGMFMALLTIAGIQASAFIFPFFFLAVRRKVSATGLSKWDSLIFLPSAAVIPFMDKAFFPVFLLLQITSITVWAIVSISRYGKKLAEMYDESEVSAGDIWQTLIFVCLSSVAVMTINLLPDQVRSNTLVAVIFSAFISVLQYLVGWYIFNIKRDEPAVELASDSEEPLPSVAKGSGEELLKKVEEQQLYLDPNLSLVTLADRLHTNRTYLSASIHACNYKNFSDYINTLRVEHFIRTVLSGKCTGIKEAAFNSGYNNLQSFYRHFTEIRQMTPKTWISHNTK